MMVQRVGAGAVEVVRALGYRPTRTLGSVTAPVEGPPSGQSLLGLQGPTGPTGGTGPTGPLGPTGPAAPSSIRTVTAAGAVTVTNADHLVVVNKTAGATTVVNLPAGTSQYFIIKDGKGDAATHNLTLTPAAGTIDGAATFVMNVNYQSISLVYTGAEWSVI